MEQRCTRLQFDAIAIFINRDKNINCYKHIIELSNYYKVIFIIPDGENDNYYIEKTKNKNILKLHVWDCYNIRQGKLIENALLSLKIIHYILWICNMNFSYFVKAAFTNIRILDITVNSNLFTCSAVEGIKSNYQYYLEYIDIVILDSTSENNNYIKTQNCKPKFFTINEINELVQYINNLPQNVEKTPKRINILYDADSMHVFTIKNYLSMFGRYSQHDITYTAATKWAKCKKGYLNKFDAVIIFYSIRVCIDGYLSPQFERALRSYSGHKILMVQDDYDNTEQTRKMIKYLNIGTVFTVVPSEYINIVYPKDRFPNVNFFNILTGYISDEIKNYPNKPPISERPIVIGYRGRKVGYWYGDLAQEKWEIGLKMKKICKLKNLKADIEWEEDKRIYSEQWLQWLTSVRAMIGTESGANIFDEKGTLKRKVNRVLSKNPKTTYQEIHAEFLEPFEGIVKMNQISPKIFEAVSLKTALILFEGYYSGILKENIHYIPLKKDFSNIDEVLSKIQDTEFLQRMVDFTYKDILGKYELTYQWLIEYFDKCIDSNYLTVGLDKQFSTFDFLLTIKKKIFSLIRFLAYLLHKY